MLWVSWGSCSSSKLIEACVLNFLTQPFPFATQSRNWWLFPCCCRIRNWTRGRLGSDSSCVSAQEPGLQLPCRFLVRHSHLVILSQVQPLRENPIHLSRQWDEAWPGNNRGSGGGLTALSAPRCLSPSPAMIWVTWSISLSLAAEISSADTFLCTLDSASNVLQAEQFQKPVLLMRKKPKVASFKVFSRNLAKCLCGFTGWVILTVRSSSGRVSLGSRVISVWVAGTH